MHHLHLILSSIACSSALLAQPAPHVTTSPKVFTGSFSNAFLSAPNTSFPLGRTGGLIQYWRRGTDLQMSQTIMATGSRPVRGHIAAATTLSGVELTMSNTQVTFTTMTRDFAANLGTQFAVVFTRKPVNLPALNASFDPDQPATWLVHDAPFLFAGPHLIVQFDLGPASGSVENRRRSDGIPFGSRWHFRSSPSCGGTLNPSQGLTEITLTLTGADPVQPGLLMVGSENVLLGGVPALPFRLDGLGMTGCVLGLDPVLEVPFIVSAAGTAIFNLPIPGYGLTSNSEVIHAQVLHTSQTTPAGLATTNTTHSVLGGAGLANYIYNWTADVPLAQAGPSTTNGGAILLFRP